MNPAAICEQRDTQWYGETWNNFLIINSQIKTYKNYIYIVFVDPHQNELLNTWGSWQQILLCNEMWLSKQFFIKNLHINNIMIILYLFANFHYNREFTMGEAGGEVAKMLCKPRYEKPQSSDGKILRNIVIREWGMQSVDHCCIASIIILIYVFVSLL